jgi:hypothetical protein
MNLLGPNSSMTSASSKPYVPRTRYIGSLPMTDGPRRPASGRRVLNRR